MWDIFSPPGATTARKSSLLGAVCFLPVVVASSMRGLTVLIAGCLADFTFGALNKRLNIAVVTDVHIGESCNGDLSLGGCKPVKALTDVVDHINKLHTIDGVFATGDLTSSALTEEFQKFREIMNGLTVPWWPLLGELKLFSTLAVLCREVNSIHSIQLLFFFNNFIQEITTVGHIPAMLTAPSTKPRRPLVTQFSLRSLVTF